MAGTREDFFKNCFSRTLFRFAQIESIYALKIYKYLQYNLHCRNPLTTKTSYYKKTKQF